MDEKIDEKIEQKDIELSPVDDTIFELINRFGNSFEVNFKVILNDEKKVRVELESAYKINADE